MVADRRIMHRYNSAAVACAVACVWVNVSKTVANVSINPMSITVPFIRWLASNFTRPALRMAAGSPGRTGRPCPGPSWLG